MPPITSASSRGCFPQRIAENKRTEWQHTQRNRHRHYPAVIDEFVARVTRLSRHATISLTLRDDAYSACTNIDNLRHSMYCCGFWCENCRSARASPRQPTRNGQVTALCFGDALKKRRRGRPTPPRIDQHCRPRDPVLTEYRSLWSRVLRVITSLRGCTPATASAATSQRIFPGVL